MEEVQKSPTRLATGIHCPEELKSEEDCLGKKGGVGGGAGAVMSISTNVLPEEPVLIPTEVHDLSWEQDFCSGKDASGPNHLLSSVPQVCFETMCLTHSLESDRT